MSKTFNKEMSIDELRRRLAEAKRDVVVSPEEVEEAEALLHIKLIEQTNERLDRTTEAMQASNQQLDHVTTVMQQGLTLQQELRQVQRRYTRLLALVVVATIATVSFLTHQRMDALDRLAVARDPEALARLAQQPPTLPFVWASFALEGLERLDQIAVDFASAATTQTAPELLATVPFLPFHSALIPLNELESLNTVATRPSHGTEASAMPPQVMRFEMGVPTAVSSWASTTDEALKQTGRATERLAQRTKAWAVSLASSWALTTGEVLKQTGRATERLAQRTKAWAVSMNTPIFQPEKSGGALSEDAPQLEATGPIYDLLSPEVLSSGDSITTMARDPKAWSIEEPALLTIDEILATSMQDLALMQASETLKAIDVTLNEAAEIVNE